MNSTIQCGPILSHQHYGERGGVSPDALWHYTDLGELLVPQAWLDEAKAYHAAKYGAEISDLATPPSDDTPRSEPSWVTEYNAAYTWEELLLGDGWQHKTDTKDGTRHWTRPGKDTRKGSSATTGHNGIDKLHVFSTSIDWLPLGRYSRWAYMVFRDFGGDFRAASQAIGAVRG